MLHLVLPSIAPRAVSTLVHERLSFGVDGAPERLEDISSSTYLQIYL